MSDNNTGWLYAHGAIGILSQADVDALKAGAHRVYGLMRGGDWHTPEQIDLAAGKGGIPARAGLRRMRDLRDLPGVTIERRHVGGRRFEYRMAVK